MVNIGQSTQVLGLFEGFDSCLVPFMHFDGILPFMQHGDSLIFTQFAGT